MRYGSICSGIGGAEVAFEPLGWECAFMSEIDPFAHAVLSHHFPDTPLFGDFREINYDGPTLDVLVGGPPCQGFSVAGARRGMADPRSQLTFAYVDLVAKLRPRWIVYENVPGLLSSGGGRDFGAFIGALEQCGYSFAWRVLDAAYFGVPQRRRRVYVVGYLGTTWQCPAAVLLDADCLSRDSTARGKARQDVAPTLSARTKGGGGLGTDFDLDGGLIPEIAGTLAAAKGRNRGLGNANEVDSLIAFSCKDFGADAGEIAPTHDGSHMNGGGQVAVAFTTQQEPKFFYNCAMTLTADSPSGGGQRQCVTDGYAVRRLTPMECERLQAFPDGWTLVPVRTTKKGKVIMASDSARYKALGNAFAACVVRAIGERIAAVDAIPMEGVT